VELVILWQLVNGVKSSAGDPIRMDSWVSSSHSQLDVDMLIL
jgi:hypothetical protein